MGRDTVESRYKAATKRADMSKHRKTGVRASKAKTTIKPQGNPLKGVYGFKVTHKF